MFIMRVNEIKIGGVLFTSIPFWRKQKKKRRKKRRAFLESEVKSSVKNVDVPCGWIELLAIKKVGWNKFSTEPIYERHRAFANIRGTFIYTAAHTCLTRRAGLQIVDSYLHFNNSSLLPCHSRSLSTTTRQPNDAHSRGRATSFSFLFHPLFLPSNYNTRVCARILTRLSSY